MTGRSSTNPLGRCSAAVGHAPPHDWTNAAQGGVPGQDGEAAYRLARCRVVRAEARYSASVGAAPRPAALVRPPAPACRPAAAGDPNRFPPTEFCGPRETLKG